MDDWQARLEPSKTTKKSGIRWIPFIANFTHDIDITSVKMHMISSTIPCSSMIPCWTTFSPPWFSNPTDHHYQTCQYHPSIDICYQQSHQTSMPQTIGRCCHDAANCALNACIQNRMRYCTENRKKSDEVWPQDSFRQPPNPKMRKFGQWEKCEPESEGGCTN